MTVIDSGMGQAATRLNKRAIALENKALPH